MSRTMKFGMVTIVAAFAVSLMVTDEAEALFRRRAHRRAWSGYGGGCCGYVQQSSCCGVAAPACQSGCETGACGVATSGCATGACGVAMGGCATGACGVAEGGYNGGYSAGYGSSIQSPTYSNPTLAPQGTLNQNAPPPPLNGNSTLNERQRNTGGNSADQSIDRSDDRGARSPSDRGDNPPPPPSAPGDQPAQPSGQGGNGAAPPPPTDR